MKRFSAPLALVLAAASLGGCSHVASATREFAGLNEEPVSTEHDTAVEDHTLMERHLRAQLIADMLVVARGEADGTGAATEFSLNLTELPEGVRDAFNELKDGRTSNNQRSISQGEFVREASAYYSFGRTAFKSRCELFLQALATVDGQISYGRDLGNNFLDAATILATAFNSPAGYALGISTAQGSFNSVYGSMERYLMLTDSVGPLRERVLEAMELAETPELEFKDSDDIQVSVRNARLAISQVQNYGVTCSEAGLRQIIGDALREEPTLESVTQAGRARSLVSGIEDAIQSVPGFGEYNVSDSDLYLLYAYIISDRQDQNEIRLIETGLPQHNNRSLLTILLERTHENQLNQVYSGLTQLADIEPYETQLRQGANALRRQAQAMAAAARSTPPAADQTGTPQ